MEEIQRKIYFRYHDQIQQLIDTDKLVGSEYKIDEETYKIINEQMDIKKV